jgi:cytochrome oxidase Cu insertion factor (SCO1/SenC/PrrC family)
VSTNAHRRYALICARARVHFCLMLGLALPFPSGAAEPTAASAAAALLDRLPANWRDEHGATLRLTALHGQRIFVTMAYTSCHRICPMTMTRLAEVQQELDERGMSAEFVIVSYDPDNDDAAAWRRYRASHHLLRDNWHFLSGTPSDTERLARVLGFEFWRDGEHVMHGFRIVALGSDGAWRGAVDSAHGDWRNLL